MTCSNNQHGSNCIALKGPRLPIIGTVMTSIDPLATRSHRGGHCSGGGKCVAGGVSVAHTESLWL